MTKKKTKTNNSTANAQRTGGEQATNAQRTRLLFVPIMENFRSYLRKDVANAPQIWLPIECNLIFRYEFAACSIQTRYIFVAILLYCGQRGIDEIPDDKRFLASALNADARTIEKAIPELENLGLLLERKKEREEKKDTDRQKETPAARVSVDSKNLSKTEGENQSENQSEEVFNNASANGHRSEFSIEECLRYVEKCKADGDSIQNAKALATSLFQTGKSDAFIRATLYPEKQADVDQRIFGKPIKFTDEPCVVCFGAKMADADGKGYRTCVHCKNERGKSTGFEPETTGETSDENQD